MKKKDIALILLSSILVTLSFPGANIFWLAWVALVPLFIAIKNKSPKSCFTLGFVCGFIVSFVMLFFIPAAMVYFGETCFLGAVTLVGLAGYYGIYFGIFAVFAGYFRKEVFKKKFSKIVFSYLIVLPCIWVMLEYGHTHLFPGIPWTFFFLGYSQWNNLYVAQIAEITSVFGVSFLIVLVNLTIYLAVSERKFNQIWITTPIVLLSCIYGWWKLSIPVSIFEEEKVKVAVLQGNIEAKTKWDQQKADFVGETYLDLNQQAVKSAPDLVVWTETAIPWPLEEGDDLMSEALQITTVSQAYHLVGSPRSAEGYVHKFYNTAYFVMPDGRITAQYSKVRPLFGIETTLLGESLPGFTVQSRQYVPAEKQAILSTPLGKIGVNICNENYYSDLSRSAVHKGAEYLVNLTNDAWFPQKIPLTWHYMLNIFRAIESRRDTIVASNVGISGIIDSCGRTKTKTDVLKPVCLIGEITKRNGQSFYSCFGDIFSYLCISFLGWALIRKTSS